MKTSKPKIYAGFTIQDLEDLLNENPKEKQFIENVNNPLHPLSNPEVEKKVRELVKEK